MSEPKKVLCTICGSNEWQNVDQYRLKPASMSLCMKCGFVTYPEIISKSEDVKEFYRAEYRDAPTVQNVFTGQRKLNYHSEFLSELFRGWKKEGFENPSICEIGAAFGMFLKWCKEMLPKAQIQGTELTTTFRRVAFWEYGISLTEELDESKKYDLIACYKVAEHIPNIEQEIKKYINCLSDRGLLYISVPTWFHALTNFGMGGFTLEYYYHTNHVNVWTRKLFETLLRKCGLEVVKRDYIFYDSTYLCKKNEAMKEVLPEYENPLEVLDWLDRVKKASQAYDSSSFQEAIDFWPNYPDAIVANYEQKRADWHKKGWDAIQKEVLDKAIEMSPNFAIISMFCADLCMRYHKWDIAIKYIDKAIKEKPNDPGALMALSHCFRALSEASTDPKDKLRLLAEARDATRFLRNSSFQHAHDAVTWIFADNAKLPIPSEQPVAAEKPPQPVEQLKSASGQ
jgi:2-polyprenyl-3-methyl-5-hydroxy-6-metoxy-1,4-benzoquinol methylase